jgi:hypothetical protein
MLTMTCGVARNRFIESGGATCSGSKIETKRCRKSVSAMRV